MGSTSETQRWHAIYTRPRWEKKVHRLLQDKGVESYCPLNKVHRKWSDRIKIVEEPLFKSYVFVKICESDKTQVRMTHGVVNFVYWMGKPAIIKDREIEIIKRFLDEYENIEVSSMQLTPQTKVIIKGGAFMDKKAVVTKVMKNKVQVVINTIGYILTAVIPSNKVLIIKGDQI
jgi:transcription antitermination factor NusG